MASEKYKDKEWLSDQLVRNHRSYKDIADELKCSKTTVYKWADKFDIDLSQRSGSIDK
jgi:transposase